MRFLLFIGLLIDFENTGTRYLLVELNENAPTLLPFLGGPNSKDKEPAPSVESLEEEKQNVPDRRNKTKTCHGGCMDEKGTPFGLDVKREGDPGPETEPDQISRSVPGEDGQNESKTQDEGSKEVASIDRGNFPDDLKEFKKGAATSEVRGGGDLAEETLPKPNIMRRQFIQKRLKEDEEEVEASEVRDEGDLAEDLLPKSKLTLKQFVQRRLKDVKEGEKLLEGAGPLVSETPPESDAKDKPTSV